MRRRGFLPTAAIVASLALLARLWTRTRLGILPTYDSFDYLQLAQRIAAGDWSSERLGTLRLPGYPVLLALLERCSLLDARALLTVQQTLGVLSAVAFAWCGWRVAGPAAALLLGAFTALHPALLLFEHQPMTETLFVASLALVLVLAERAVGGRRTFKDGLGLGLAAAIVVLVRANGVPLVLALIAGCLLVVARADSGAAAKRFAFAPFAAGTLAGVLMLLGPWLVRQELRLGRPSLTEIAENRLVYLAQHRLLDPTLPRFAPYLAQFDPARPSTIYDLIGWLVERPRPEAASHPIQALLSEQLRARPRQLREARVRSFLAFLGVPVWGERPPWGQEDLRYWLFELVPPRAEAEVARIAGQRRELSRLLPGADSPPRREGARIWSRAGMALLVRGRPALGLTLVLLLILPPYQRIRLPRDAMLVALGTALIGTVLLHGWMLAGYERFAVPFDPLLLLGGVMAVERRRADRRGTPPREGYPEELQPPSPPDSKSSAKIDPGSAGARQEG